MYAPVALALESTHPSSLLLRLAYSFRRMAQPFFVSRAWLHTSMYAPGALALESTHPSSLLLGLAYSFGRIGCPFFVFSLGYVCPYTRPSRSSVAIACGRHRYHPAKGSFARFPSGVSLNATMQFTLLPSELGQNLSFSGADCDIHRYTVSMVSFFDRSGVSLNATMQFTLLPSELGQNLSFSGTDYFFTNN